MSQNPMPGSKVRIRVEYKVEYADPIQVVSGERVSVGGEDDEFAGWKWCKASDGREGWIPIELLSNEGADATVMEDYSARELAVRPEEEVMIEEVRHDWLLVRNAQGERGWIPLRTLQAEFHDNRPAEGRHRQISTS
jgi:SH3-like domain-containing protein